jgi:hypothetical protein
MKNGGVNQRLSRGLPGSLLYASPLPQSRSGLGPWNTEATIQLVDPAVDFLPHFGEALLFELLPLFQKPKAFTDYFRGGGVASALYLVVHHLFQFWC